MAVSISLYIIEAHPAVRRALVTRMERDGELSVVGASAYPPALAELDALRPQVIVLGLSRQHRGGLRGVEDVVRTLSAVAPVLVLTPYVDDGEVQRLTAAGARHYLLKLIDSSSLIAVVKRMAGAPNHAVKRNEPLLYNNGSNASYAPA